MIYRFILNIAVILTFVGTTVNASSQQYFSIQGGIGLGKVQFYENYHPVYLSSQSNADIKFNPSWNIAIRSTWPINEKFDFALSASHLTITGRREAARPSWTNPSEENFTQGFFHLFPSFSYKPNISFSISSGIRIGMANPFDSGNAKEASNSFLNSDIALTNQVLFKAGQRLSLGVDWIEGLTYYDYFEQQTTIPYYTFFKYRTFLIVCQYDFQSQKRR